MIVEFECSSIEKALNLSFDICKQLAGNEDFINCKIGVTDPDTMGKFEVWVKDDCKTDPKIKVLVN